MPSIYLTRLANLGLTPEYSRGPQGGVEIYYGNIGSFTISRYWQTVTDLIEFSPVDSTLATHLPEGINHSHGWIPTHNANLTITYAVRRTNLSLVSNFIGAAPNATTRKEEIAWRDGRLKQYMDTGRQPSGLVGYRPGYTISDLAVTHQCTSWATVTMNVTNLGNSYATDRSHMTPALGRQTLLGVSFRFPR